MFHSLLRLGVLFAFIGSSSDALTSEIINCPPSPPAENLILSSKLLIFGEIHGTSNTPEYVGGLLCRLTKRNQELFVGLEIPISEQTRISDYLKSNGASDDKSTLTASVFWNRPTNRQDGRSSAAMFDLIEHIRHLNRQGTHINLLAIDADPSTGLEDRDEFMANVIRQNIPASGDALFIALVGNIHAKKLKGNFLNSNYESLAFKLKELNPLTVNVRFLSGNAWTCDGKDCTSRALFKNTSLNKDNLGFRVHEEKNTEYDMSLILSEAHASEPINYQN